MSAMGHDQLTTASARAPRADAVATAPTGAPGRSTLTERLPTANRHAPSPPQTREATTWESERDQVTQKQWNTLWTSMDIRDRLPKIALSILAGLAIARLAPLLGFALLRSSILAKLGQAGIGGATAIQVDKWLSAVKANDVDAAKAHFTRVVELGGAATPILARGAAGAATQAAQAEASAAESTAVARLGHSVDAVDPASTAVSLARYVLLDDAGRPVLVPALGGGSPGRQSNPPAGGGEGLPLSPHSEGALQNMELNWRYWNRSSRTEALRELLQHELMRYGVRGLIIRMANPGEFVGFDQRTGIVHIPLSVVKGTPDWKELKDRLPQLITVIVERWNLLVYSVTHDVEAAKAQFSLQAFLSAQHNVTERNARPTLETARVTQLFDAMTSGQLEPRSAWNIGPRDDADSPKPSSRPPQLSRRHGDLNFDDDFYVQLRAIAEISQTLSDVQLCHRLELTVNLQLEKFGGFPVHITAMYTSGFYPKAWVIGVSRELLRSLRTGDEFQASLESLGEEIAYNAVKACQSSRIIIYVSHYLGSEHSITSYYPPHVIHAAKQRKADLTLEERRRTAILLKSMGAAESIVAASDLESTGRAKREAEAGFEAASRAYDRCSARKADAYETLQRARIRFDRVLRNSRGREDSPAHEFFEALNELDAAQEAYDVANAEFESAEARGVETSGASFQTANEYEEARRRYGRRTEEAEAQSLARKVRKKIRRQSDAHFQSEEQ